MALRRITTAESLGLLTVVRRAAHWPLRRKLKTLGWFVMGLMAAFVFRVVEVPYLNPLHALRPHHLQIRWLLVPHIVLGSLAMLIGPLQFSSRMRRLRPGLHRVLGRLYVAAVAVAAPLAMSIPLYLNQNPLYIIGTVAHSGTWLVATVTAAAFAFRRQLVQHQQWIVRSYVLTFSFVIVRIFSHYTNLNDEQFALADVTITLLCLLLSDLGISVADSQCSPSAAAVANR